MTTLTPSKITAWLDCAHYVTMLDRAEAGQIERRQGVGSFAQLLMNKGLQHERDYLDALREQGASVADVPDRPRGERFETWAERFAPVLAEGHDVIYQMPFVHDGMRGISDFLIKTDRPSALGTFSYEPVDAKLARLEAKPGHVLQLCFYADALEEAQGVRPAKAHLYLGSGESEVIALPEVSAYWRRIRRQLRTVVAAGPQLDTAPVPCRHCEFCEFADHCDAVWRAEDALHYVAGIRATDIEALTDAGVTTRAGLAAGLTDVALSAERLAVIEQQARLQVAAVEGERPPYEPIPPEPTSDPDTVRRRQLPPPDDADVFLDFEGHPFWTPARGLFFMVGMWRRDDAGVWGYEAWWAHTVEDEGAMAGRLIEWIGERRRQSSGMHVYHYNHTERSSLERLARDHATHEHLLGALVETGVFVDLLDVVRHTLRVGAEGYSLKVLERLAGYERGHDIDAGAGAVVAYDDWMTSGEPALLEMIARYNEDDVRATKAVRDWLVTGPLRRQAPRPPAEVAEDESETDQLAADLMAMGEPWTELLAHLLEYWSREGRAHRAQNLPAVLADEADRLDHPSVISSLDFVETLDPVGRQKFPGAVFTFPEQEISPDIVRMKHKTVMFPVGEGQVRSAEVRAIDIDAGSVTFAWPDDLKVMPAAVVVNDWIGPGAKYDSVKALAERVVAGELYGLDELRRAVLRGEAPAFRDGGGPDGGLFPSNVDDIVEVAAGLTGGCLPVQGPPGTGKTFTGSKVIARLLDDGKRVAVTSFSHAAIDNLLAAVMKERPETKALRQGGKPGPPRTPIDDVRYGGNAATWAKGTHELFGSTAWTLSSEAAANTVDVLIIDEAGQFGLADAIAAMSCARSVIMLGDPLQLAQVSLASHPGGSGLSALEHLLDGEATIAPERGVFLETTWRMHPKLTSFLSEQIYDGRLGAHPHCAGQSVGGQAGLRWIRAEHDGNDTSAVEEAVLVVETIRALIGQTWADFDGAARPLVPADVMVVAPYNDHVTLVRETLDSQPDLVDVRVGTVDKFQGQEAPVVIFTMATSNGASMPRGAEFLYSRNRLNVAISRARALAYVVCTEELLDTRAGSVEEMRLIGTLCAFVERTQLDGLVGAPR